MLPFFIGTGWDNYGVSPKMRLWKCSSAPKERASSWTTKKMAGKGFAFIISTMVTHYDAQYGHWLGVLSICAATTPGHEIICPNTMSTGHAKMSRQKTSANTSN
jgi:hypothetical protein